MASCRRLRSWVIVAATLCCASSWQARAWAGSVFDYRYGGVVTNVTDQYGVFGSVAIGDTVNGIIRYAVPTPPPDYADPTFAQYDLPVTPGGTTLMTASLGALHLQSMQDVFVQSYNMEDPNSPGDSLYGHDFQFIDGDTSVLHTGGLPSGFKLTFAGADFGLFSTDRSLIPFPDPPSMLLAIEQYDSYFTGGILSVDVVNASGHFVENSVIEFQLTELSAVPEPRSALLLGIALPFIIAFGLWKRR
jgi:hypothetical protein